MNITIRHLIQILVDPNRVFERLARDEPDPARVFFGLTIWLLLLPPLFALVGTLRFGWLLGVEPLRVPPESAIGISVGYFLLLLTGFLSTALIAGWMAKTYGASSAMGPTFALISIVGAPLAIGSVAHLYPHAFINVLILVPVMIWSLYLLYRGLPVVLDTGPGRGMLMASALVGYLLVAWVSLIGITVVLWGIGLGPRLSL